MLSPQSREYFLLYMDDLGDEVGFDEVQLIDPPLKERIPELSAMLNGAEPYLSYQATLMLTAWGEDIGLDKVEEIVEKEQLIGFQFSPNRITGEDNIYDELAYAVHLYCLSVGENKKVVEVFRKFLQIYSKYFFESKLKHSLMKHEFPILVPFIDEAIETTALVGKNRQASQLLPVLSKYDAQMGWHRVQKFSSVEPMSPSIVLNIIEALKYCNRDESKALLHTYSLSEDRRISEEAKNSLAYISNNDEGSAI
ncbi:hypothetical protein MADA3029_830138 [Vibrio nigripulchritudo MADA3029]|uniref:hypothetical protein n=1 Tax=Vibrio nigripulchritudo TaxID=28173 RepID=UPI0003B22AB5|nr:hypothetical protein [Vibrio nigripulchritudo]KJY79733.1 hypothetical protein TW74_08045 [Vibrio nigripulchritudo]CCN45736.1 hypothetical protein VIBNIMADA3020_1100129 [Vibrio nigripulchritudo MADA3020]CCN52922.1 hypothetical protein VIBNIMADA3021_170058 [Vibrio nigripulchritudo MADA3021]CCN61643.1 hypothetical protein MADA3029_830138 [Vibrio nigripulchritudo MADA3029]